MLSAGERPQHPATSAIVDAPTVIMPNIEPKTISSSSSILSRQTMGPPMPVQHIWVVTGPAGCGKSTVGQALRKELGASFLEGDDVRGSPGQRPPEPTR